MEKRIGEYGIIGDCHSAALVGRDGSLDWLCWPRFDSAALFAALLDEERGGCWRISPADVIGMQRAYVGASNVLQTRWQCRGGSLVLTDLMPVASESEKHRRLAPEHEILRQVECTAGECEIEIRFEPRPRYGQAGARLRERGALGTVMEMGRGVCWLRSSAGLEVRDGRAECRRRLRAGERVQMSLTYAEDAPAVLPPFGGRVDEAIARAVRWWQEWAGQARYDGPYREPVVRSALALKLMSYAPSGAIVAAPTTSLPERIGGGWNWDYRYCWLRDASLTVRALLELGFRREAQAFLSWLLHATRITQPSLDVLYTVFGEHSPAEEELGWLAGHRGSRPVRTGNAARDQLQLDVHGEVVDAAAQFALRGGSFDHATQEVLAGFGEYVCRHWREADEGIWEPRSGRAHHTHSRLLCWTALDRLVRMEERGLIKAQRARFAEARDAIAADLRAHGWSEALQSYTAAYGGEHMDASLLLLAWYGFEAADSPRMRSTYARVRSELGAGDLLYRYRTDPPEGAFGLCSFWEVEYLARGGGTLAQACALFEKLLAYRNDLGLLAEEIDPGSGEPLGNFPQAFTHVGLISAAITIEERRRGRLHASGDEAAPTAKENHKGHEGSQSREGVRLGSLGHYRSLWALWLAGVAA